MSAAVKKKTEVVSASVDQGEVFKQLALIKKEIESVQDGFDTVPAQLVTVQDYGNACALLIGIVERRKYADEQRDAFMEDVRKMIDRVNGWFDPVLKPANELEATLRTSVEEFALRLHEEAMGLRRAAARVKGDKRRSELLTEADNTKPPKIGGISIRTKPVVQITDDKRLPEALTMRVPNVKAIQAELEAGRDVPGALLVVTKGVTVTPKNAQKDE